MNVRREMYPHMEWADAIVWRAVAAAPAAHDDKRLRDLLIHLHTVQRAFFQLWQRQPVAIPSEFGSLDDVRQWARGYHSEVAAFLSTLTEDDLSRELPIPWAEHLHARFGKVPQPVTVEESMIHVATHSTYHRGQVNTRLRELGGEPPLTDYVAWLWLGRPSAEW